MHNWFETTVKFEKTAEDGKIVKVSQKNLVDAKQQAPCLYRLATLKKLAKDLWKE